MQYLIPSNAQMIADKIMEVVPYNINIMNKSGVIIASGDKLRIATVHRGAVKALEMREAYIVYEDTETERKGINLPIFYNNEIAGVIGISGDVDDVMQIGQIVVTTAQLMIENQVYNEMSAIKESRLNSFYYEWSQRKENEYDEKFVGQAEYFHVELAKPRAAVFIIMKRIRYSAIDRLKSMLTRDDHILRQSMDSILILMADDNKLHSRLESIMDISSDLKHCFVGESDMIASIAVKNESKTRRIAIGLKKEGRITYHEDLQLEYLLEGINVNRGLEEIIEKLNEKDTDGNLIKTILAYAELSEDNKAVCEKLFIHRNTLNYRLDKIQEVTGLNPRNGKNLMMLYIAVFEYIMQKKT